LPGISITFSVYYSFKLCILKSTKVKLLSDVFIRTNVEGRSKLCHMLTITSRRE